MPDLQDFFELCESNKSSLEERYERCRRKCDPSLHDEFISTIAMAKISINRRPASLQRLLSEGKLTNVHESPNEPNAPRKAFDSLFTQGKTFIYGALNPGGPGIGIYGCFCVVIDLSRAPRHGYVMRDSLKFYMDRDAALSDLPKFDLQRLGQDVSPESHKVHLATIKHHDSLVDTVGSRSMTFAQLLCSNSEYIEAIMEGPIRKEHIDIVLAPDWLKLAAVDGDRQKRDLCVYLSEKVWEIVDAGKKAGFLIGLYELDIENLK